jgi:hypothetical protein
MTQAESVAGFETTPWTQILAARGGTPTEQTQLLEDLSRRYWAAAYAYLRRRGVDREQAGELTQAFFADVVLGRDLFERAVPERGSLRGLMRRSLGNYVIDAHRREVARGSDRRVPVEQVDREEALLARHEKLTADELFERRWRMAVLDGALRQCREHFERNGTARNWAVFEARVLTPSIGAADPPPLAHLADQHGFRNAADAAAAVQTVKRRLNAILAEHESE